MDPLTPTARPLALEMPVFIVTRTIMHTIVRMIYPFLGVFVRGLGVDLYLVSRALSLRSLAALVGVLLAMAGDTRGRRFGMLFGMALFTAGAGVMAVWPGYPAFVTMLILSALAYYVFVPAMQSYLGDKVAYERRGLVLGLTEISWSLAYIAGVPIIGLIIARSGWSAPFAWMAGAGGLSLLLLAWLLPKDRQAPRRGAGFIKNLGTVLSSRAALAGIVVAIALCGGNELISLVYGVWLEQAFQVQISGLSTTAMLIGLAELGGEGLVSGLADRLGKRRAVGIGIGLNALAALSIIWLGGSLPGAMLVLLLFFLTFEFTIVSCLPLITEVVPAARVTYMAVFIAGTAVGRAVCAPVAPWLFDLGKSLNLGAGLAAPMLAIVGGVAALDLAALAALSRIDETPALKGVSPGAPPV